MSVAPITLALQHQLEQIPDLRVFPYVPDTVTPPAALIQLPETLRNPTDRIVDKFWRYRIIVSLVLGRVSDRDIPQKYDHYRTQLEQQLPLIGADLGGEGGCHAFVNEFRKPRQVSYAGTDVMQCDVVVQVWSA